MTVGGVIQAHAVLSSFDKKLQEYTRQVFERNNIDLRIGVSVKEVRPHEVVLQDDSVEKCGFVLWSTGIAPRPFIRQSNSLPVDMRGRITVDEFLQVTCLPDATNSLSPELVAGVWSLVFLLRVFTPGSCYGSGCSSLFFLHCVFACSLSAFPPSAILAFHCWVCVCLAESRVSDCD